MQNDEAMILFLFAVCAPNMERSRWSPNCFVFMTGQEFFFFFEEIWNKFFKRAAVLNHSWFVDMSEMNFIWFSVCWIYTYYSYFFKIALTLLILCIPILIFFSKENNLILPDVWMICTSFSKHGLRKYYYMSCCLKIYFFQGK